MSDSKMTTWRPNWPMLAIIVLGVAFNLVEHEWLAAIVITIVGMAGQIGVVREGNIDA
jgi:hypothetical protein